VVATTLPLLRWNYFLSDVVLIKLFKSLTLKILLLSLMSYTLSDRFLIHSLIPTNYKLLLLLKILGHSLTKTLAILLLFRIAPAVQNGALT